jgi:hypothetical protein
MTTKTKRFMEVPGIDLAGKAVIFSSDSVPTSSTDNENNVYPEGSLCILTNGGVAQFNAGVWTVLKHITEGVATLDFGTFPGSNEASVRVDADVNETVTPIAFFMSDTSEDHSENDHRYASLFIRLTCSAGDGSGFTIYGISQYQMEGRFQIHWKY